MKFEALDKTMRVFETAHDYCVLPDVYMVARIDGRSFTRLTKELHEFEAPFDVRFRDFMIETTKHLMDVGFRITYGYTQSDEISLMFHKDDNVFSRKLRKLNSVLAGEASAKFSLQLNDVAAFDCRISQLPSVDRAIDYFRWRHEDAHRNALNAHCYWLLRRLGETANAATKHLSGLSTSEKNELLFDKGNTNFNSLPKWQRRGTGLYWTEIEVDGFDPIRQKEAKATRKKIEVNFELPMKDEYDNFIKTIIVD